MNISEIKSSVALPGVYYQDFITSGTFTPPAGVTWVTILMIGGGGGGGGGCGLSATPIAGGGGGSGFPFYGDVAVVGPVTVTIGAGGAGGVVYTDGSDGASTSFGMISTPGGSKGYTGVGDGHGGSGGAGASGGGGGWGKISGFGGGGDGGPGGIGTDGYASADSVGGPGVLGSTSNIPIGMSAGFAAGPPQSQGWPLSPNQIAGAGGGGGGISVTGAPTSYGYGYGGQGGLGQKSAYGGGSPGSAGGDGFCRVTWIIP